MGSAYMQALRHPPVANKLEGSGELRVCLAKTSRAYAVARDGISRTVRIVEISHTVRMLENPHIPSPHFISCAAGLEMDDHHADLRTRKGTQHSYATGPGGMYQPQQQHSHHQPVTSATPTP
jgi:hypothetical protein